MQTAKDITGLRAWELLNSNSRAILMYLFIGLVELIPLIIQRKFKTAVGIQNSEIKLDPDVAPRTPLYDDSECPTIIFMCKTSVRSKIAASIAINNAYNDCFLLSGGYSGSNMCPGWLNSKIFRMK